MSGKTQPINVMIDTNLKQKISENRKKLIPVVEIIILCGRLGLPLRGHRDDSKYHPEVGEYSEGGVGNFIELLNYRVRSGDVGSYLRKCSCCHVVVEQNVDKIKLLFIVIRKKETAYCFDKVKVPLVLCFVDSISNP